MAKKKDVASKQTKAEAKPSQKHTTILALKRPSPPPVVEKSVEEEVISPADSTDTSVSDDAVSLPPLPKKPSLVVAESTTESTDITHPVELVESKQPDPDPLIGTKIEVTAPWGAKVMVEVCGTYLAPGGDKWVAFNALEEIPAGWKWQGGVKRLEVLNS